MLSTRRLTDKKVLPLMHGMAFRNDGIDRGIARRMPPPSASHTANGPGIRWSKVNQEIRR